MTFPRTPLSPVLPIAVGGTVGALLTLGSLALRSLSNQVHVDRSPDWLPDHPDGDHDR
jgi:hypothetical protein